MKALSKLYTANCDNRVVAFGTNLKDFVDTFAGTESNIDNYFNLRRKFEKSDEILFKGISGKEYLLQSVYKRDKD